MCAFWLVETKSINEKTRWKSGKYLSKYPAGLKPSNEKVLPMLITKHNT